MGEKKNRRENFRFNLFRFPKISKSLVSSTEEASYTAAGLFATVPPSVSVSSNCSSLPFIRSASIRLFPPRCTLSKTGPYRTYGFLTDFPNTLLPYMQARLHSRCISRSASEFLAIALSRDMIY